MEWLAGDDNRARGIILRAAGLDANATGAMATLRAKRWLEDRMRSHGSVEEWKDRESWACLRALLEVLAGGTGAVEEGMDVLKSYVKEHGLEGVPRESAWTRMVLLGWKHATVLGRQMRRAAVRNAVMQVVADLERVGGGMNTAILGVFLEGEKGESVWGRVRALVGEGAIVKGDERGLAFKSSDKGVARRIWEVWLANWERGGWEGEKERVRNSLGIGVEEDRCVYNQFLSLSRFTL
jgi:nuclear exosome regulator NRDE2